MNYLYIKNIKKKVEINHEIKVKIIVIIKVVN